MKINLFILSINKEKLGILVIIVITLLALIGMLFQNPIAQDINYHSFSDTREFLFITNFWNVVSNMLLLIVATLGLYKLIVAETLHIIRDIKISYIILFAGTVLISFASSYYHLYPNNQTLALDRLAMVIVFMTLFSIVISEFISTKVGKQLLLPFILAGILSVIYWYISEIRGGGDLRFYAFVQFYPLLVIPVILLCFSSRCNNTDAYWMLLTAYIIAKVFEFYDSEIYYLLEFISGHSIKHIVSAIGLYILLISYERRNT